MIGMALLAVLTCVNFAACSSGDDDPTEEKGEGGIVVYSKKLTKIVADSPETKVYTVFTYDNKGRLIKVTEKEVYGDNIETDTYQFVWDDNAIKVTETNSSSGPGSNFSNTENYTFGLKNGLVQYGDSEGYETYTYDSSGRLIRYGDESWAGTATWNGNKLMSVSEDDLKGTLTYGTSCPKGYFPLIVLIVEAGECDYLFMAHPEIAGIRTAKLPSSITWTYTDDNGKASETNTLAYEFDNEGYISKIKGDVGEGAYTYTLTWE